MRCAIRHSANRKVRAHGQGMQTRLRGHTSRPIVTILNQRREETCRSQFNAGVTKSVTVCKS